MDFHRRNRRGNFGNVISAFEIFRKIEQVKDAKPC